MTDEQREAAFKYDREAIPRREAPRSGAWADWPKAVEAPEQGLARVIAGLRAPRRLAPGARLPVVFLPAGPYSYTDLRALVDAMEAAGRGEP